MESRPWYVLTIATPLRRPPSLSNPRLAQIISCLFCGVWIAACGGGSSYSQPSNNPAPSLSSVSPTSATAGGSAFTLTVTGSSFIPSSTVQWNGSARTTTFVSGTSLQVAISAADIALPGAASMTVSTPAPGGGTSSALTFTIDNPAPAVSSLSPNTTATVQSFNLTTRAAIASITIPSVTGNPQRLIRWGQNGLAFNTDGGLIYLIGGNFVH